MASSKTKSLLGPVPQWLRSWCAGRERAGEFARCTKEELDLIGNDVGLSGTDLCALAGKGVHVADLLPRRLSSMGLDPDALDTPMLRDMQRLCSFCQSKGRCKRDLDRSLSALPGYCPNGFSIRSVIADRGARLA